MTLLNQRGVTTIDFLFAIIIAGGLSAIVFAVTYTLTVVEVTQYIAFSTARAHLAGNVDMASQEKSARDKYEALTSSDAFRSLYSGSWFSVSPANEIEIRQGPTHFADDYPAQTEGNREVFHGVRINLTADILQMNLPFIGRVVPEDDSFTTRVAAFLIREPSFDECKRFLEDRQNAMWSVGGSRFSQFNRNASVDVAWEDNGC